mmetsp:Transcript_12122/g.17428  ORF Transcript_12122/g.17428 Transcript_12122/m.17428 type:complete len:292 (+) Transcript_12122:412-1287(+)
MMSRTACCFLSIDASHHHCQETFIPTFHTVRSTNVRHKSKSIRHIDGASSFHRRCKHTKRTRSSYHWSLKTQLDDDSSPSRKRRRRNRARDANLNNDRDNITDTIASILFQPVSIPLSNIIGSDKQRQRLPAIYPLSLIATFAILPPITSAMVAIFFGVYLALLLPLLDESDDISLDENDDEQDFDEINMSSAAPAVAYLGAVASAALLSPQGLIASSENDGGLSLSSVPYLLASLLVGLVGFVLFSGVNETATDKRKWEREEIEALPERKERSVMKQWDDELKEKDDGLN